MNCGKGTSKSMSRFSFTMHKGPLREGMCALHHCDNPKCVNPHHLFEGTKADNHADMDRKGRRVPPRGARNFNTKMTESKVLEARALNAQGIICNRLAEKFNVSKATMYQILKRQTWDYI